MTRRTLVELALVVLGVGAVGAVAGVVWEWVWTPTLGVVREDPESGAHVWSAGDVMGLQQQFSGTGWFVVVGVVAGLLAGLLAALLVDRVPLLTLGAVALGSALAVWLMLTVGIALGPADADAVARTAAVGDRVPADLAVSGHSPWIAFPVGALLGVALVFIGLSPRSAAPSRPDGGEVPTEIGAAG